MSDAPWSGNESLPLTMAQRVDGLCNRFEQAWKDGHRPTIEDFLADLSEPERAALLRELVHLDADYRRRQGEEPQPAEYHARFPEFGSQWVADLVAGPQSAQPRPGPAPCQPAADSIREEKTVPPDPSPIPRAVPAWPAVARRRRTAKELGLRPNPPHIGGRPWTAKELQLLGTVPDDELAERTARTARAVRTMRTRRGIATAGDRRRRNHRAAEKGTKR